MKLDKTNTKIILKASTLFQFKYNNNYYLAGKQIKKQKEDKPIININYIS